MIPSSLSYRTELLAFDRACRSMMRKTGHRTELWPVHSDAGVPRIAEIRLRRAQAVVHALQRVRHGHAGEILQALVSQLPRHPHPQRAAEGHGKIAVIHPPG